MDRTSVLFLLNNRLYIGEVTWNRFRWERNPESGKRVPRPRPPEKWEVQRCEGLRIIPQDLWEHVRQRQQEVSRKSATQAYRVVGARSTFSPDCSYAECAGPGT